MPVRLLRGLPLLALLILLSGCSAVVLKPAGDIAVQQRDLIIISTVLMLLIIVPVIFLSLFFAWRYRASNRDARYEPDWHHSTQLELIIWSAPLLIIIALGALTWITTHTLDPYRPVERLDAARRLPADAKTLDVQVVALDWKWLFIYPGYGIATVNELAAPVDTPIHFTLTASSVMNSFFIPALAGQVYAMPAMQTQLHAVINAPGEFEGFSANYSGAGFSDMKFKFHGLAQADFARWVERVKRDGTALRREDYQQLEKPSVREPVRHYATVDASLFDAIVNLCVDRTKMCMSQMMAIDAQGGIGGLAGIANVANLAYDRPRAIAAGERPRGNYVLSMCSADLVPAAFSSRLAASAAR
ncbi:ubiquinol oxidase subunit II [Solimonas soli]|uniref:ubiquinol oxidase subunit II n=1 Tax=Solimonas soli TaxID=413479 RepID=UPI00048882AB|nr:ubiquinol oxidase subunit II [Solimonas soli]